MRKRIADALLAGGHVAQQALPETFVESVAQGMQGSTRKGMKAQLMGGEVRQKRKLTRSSTRWSRSGRCLKMSTGQAGRANHGGGLLDKVASKPQVVATCLHGLPDRIEAIYRRVKYRNFYRSRSRRDQATRRRKEKGGHRPKVSRNNKGCRRGTSGQRKEESR